jgi:hypothetical protein
LQTPFVVAETNWKDGSREALSHPNSCSQDRNERDTGSGLIGGNPHLFGVPRPFQQDAPRMSDGSSVTISQDSNQVQDSNQARMPSSGRSSVNNALTGLINVIYDESGIVESPPVDNGDSPLYVPTIQQSSTTSQPHIVSAFATNFCGS